MTRPTSTIDRLGARVVTLQHPRFVYLRVLFGMPLLHPVLIDALGENQLLRPGIAPLEVQLLALSLEGFEREGGVVRRVRLGRLPCERARR